MVNGNFEVANSHDHAYDQFSLRAGSPCAEMKACNNRGGNSITRGNQRPQVPLGGDCQINKMQNKLKSMEKSNKFKASLSSFEEIRMLDVKLN